MMMMMMMKQTMQLVIYTVKEAQAILHVKSWLNIPYKDNYTTTHIY